MTRPIFVIAAVVFIVLSAGAMAWIVRTGRRWLENPKGWIE